MSPFPPRRQEGGGGAGGGGGGGGRVVALVTVALVFLGILLVMLLSCHHHPRRPHAAAGLTYATGKWSGPFPALSPLQRPLLAGPCPPSPCPSLTSITEEAPLWEVVAAGDLGAVEALLGEGRDPLLVEEGRVTSPLLDAHLLGRGHVLRALTRHLHHLGDLPQDTLIKEVLYEWEKLVGRVFLAAEFGVYRRDGGVESLLKESNLPTTLRDSQGRTILHLIASPTPMDSRPPWEPKDIARFLSSHLICPNAVDYKGRTPLHYLALHPNHDLDNCSEDAFGPPDDPQQPEERVIWGGEEWGVDKAWEKVAMTLLQHGCDPRLPDHQGHLPHHLAREAGNHHLANLLRQHCEELGAVGEADSDLYAKVVEAARRGDTTALRGLLSTGPPPPPLSSPPGLHPLAEAVRGCHRDAVLMLLCAGTSLCCGGAVTPLEVAHNLPQLPAIFPALLRKAYCDQLEAEVSAAPKESPLYQAVTSYSLQVIDVGDKARWIYKARDTKGRLQEALGILRVAAREGLPLTCEILGQEDLCLHAQPPAHLPFSPDTPAATRRVLHRDLQMSPFAVTIQDDMWSSEGVLEIRRAEENLLKDLYLEHDPRLQDSVLWITQLLRDPLQRKDSVVVDAETLRGVLYLCAREGLVAALHALLARHPTTALDQVVEGWTSSTGLHVAVARGRLAVVEFLACRGAALGQRAVGGMTPAHLAAVTGRRALLTYLQTHMARLEVVDASCDLGFTSTELMRAYEAFRGRTQTQVLPRGDTLRVLCALGEESRTTEILRSQGSFLGVKLPGDLLGASSESTKVRSSAQKVYGKVMREMKAICTLLERVELKGKLVYVSPKVEGGVGEGLDHLCFVYTCEEGRTVLGEESGDVAMTVAASGSLAKVNSASPGGLSFTRLLRHILQDYRTSSPDAALVPPYATATATGASLHWLCEYQGDVRFIRVSLHLVLPTPKDSHILPGATPTAPTPSGEQNSVKSEILRNAAILESLEGEWRRVWSTCRLLNQLLECRWSSSSHTGVTPLPGPLLASCFLHETKEQGKLNCDKSIFKRLMAVFKRVASVDSSRDVGVSWGAATSLRTPSPRDTASGVVRYLEELSLAQDHQDTIPKVKFEDDL